MRGCFTPRLQQGGTEEPETNPSLPQQEEQPDATECKLVADYNLDVDYEPEGSVSYIKAVDEEEANSNAEYAKIELP